MKVKEESMTTTPKPEEVLKKWRKHPKPYLAEYDSPQFCELITALRQSVAACEALIVERDELKNHDVWATIRYENERGNRLEAERDQAIRERDDATVDARQYQERLQRAVDGGKAIVAERDKLKAQLDAAVDALTSFTIVICDGCRNDARAALAKIGAKP